jgi:hypothetical protein
LQKRIISTNPQIVDKCPIEKPFAKNGVCIKCDEGFPLFNLKNE